MASAMGNFGDDDPYSTQELLKEILLLLEQIRLHDGEEGDYSFEGSYRHPDDHDHLNLSMPLNLAQTNACPTHPNQLFTPSPQPVLDGQIVNRLHQCVDHLEVTGDSVKGGVHVPKRGGRHPDWSDRVKRLNLMLLEDSLGWVKGKDWDFIKPQVECDVSSEVERLCSSPAFTSAARDKIMTPWVPLLKQQVESEVFRKLDCFSSAGLHNYGDDPVFASYKVFASAYVDVLQSSRACLTHSDLRRGFCSTEWSEPIREYLPSLSETFQGVEMPDSATKSQYNAHMQSLLKDQIKIALEPVLEPMTAALLLQGREDRKQRQKLIAKAEQKLSLQKAKVQRLKRRRACRFQPSRRAFATKLSGTKSAHDPCA